MKLFIKKTIHEWNPQNGRTIHKQIYLATPWGKIPLLSTKPQEGTRSMLHTITKKK